MKKVFTYRKFGVEDLDKIVESFQVLCNKYFEGKGETPEYKEANKEFNESLMRACFSRMPLYNMDEFSMEDVKNPMYFNNAFFIQTFETIEAQMLTPVIPTLLAKGFDGLYDMTQVGYGDNAKFRVKSNEMFVVNEIATGIAHGGVVTKYDTEYTIQASKREIGAYVDWYHVASGVMDWGWFGVEAARAYAMLINGMVVKKLESVVKTNAAAHGIAGYICNGFSDANWVTTARNVELANGGSKVYAFGTKIGLQNVLPDNSINSQFRFDENSALVKVGYLPSYKEVPLVELGQGLLPNTVNGTPTVFVDDKVIYMLPLGMGAPIHVVQEGTTMSVERNALESADHTYAQWINMYLGVDVVVGAKFGAIILP